MDNFTNSINSSSLPQVARGFLLSPKAAKFVSALLILFILYLIAAFSWTVWEYFQPKPDLKIVSTTTTTRSANTDIQQLTSFNLFGDAKPKPKPVVADSSELNAPVTRLDLKLRGVYSASENDLAGAMIEAQNKQDVYRIGGKLPGATGLKLHKILSDRIIMSRAGKFETLFIDDFGQSKGTNKNSTSSREPKGRETTFNAGGNNSDIIDKRKDKNLTKELIKLRSKLSDPQSLSELVSVSPALVNEEFQGFRIAPGKNRSLFSRMGLRRNDVISAVNGISLDDPASAFSLMEQISTADELSLTIKRGERDLNILFSAQSN
ncbi:MAG: type II secretion system protein GspC [Gammaproteobacteria bacterium]|nr:type II secretion system protein GspC [Gammaproteobacteria bacterium]